MTRQTTSAEAIWPMEHAPAWLINSLIYLSAAVIVVQLSKALGLSTWVSAIDEKRPRSTMQSNLSCLVLENQPHHRKGQGVLNLNILPGSSHCSSDIKNLSKIKIIPKHIPI